MRDTKPVEGIGYTTTLRSIQLQWKQKQYYLDVLLSKTTNVATFRSTPGYQCYTNFCNEEAISFDKEDLKPQISNSAIIDDEDVEIPWINKRGIEERENNKIIFSLMN